MRKFIFILIFSLTSFIAYCQDVRGTRIIGTQTFYFVDRYLNGTYNDTVLLNGVTDKIVTPNAIYDFVVGRTAGGGGGGSGTVTNIATGLGLSGGPITTTGTILVDTANASILSRQRAANTYALIGAVSNPLFPVTGTGTATGNVIGSLAGNVLTVVESGNEFLNITPTAGSEGVILQAFNTTGGDNRGGIYGLSDNAAASSSIYADFNASADRADIVLSASTGVTSITHTAVTHTFNANGSPALLLDGTVDNEVSVLKALNITGGDNSSLFSATAAPDQANAEILARFNDGEKDARILAHAESGLSYLTYTGDTHTFTGNILNVNRTLLNQGADVASAAGAIALGGDGNSFEITGTAAITLISNLSWQNGSEVTLIFTSTATLTDGTANSGTDIGMELAGNANFVATANDVLTLVLSEVGGTQRWREKSRSVN
jgi:hypothetical protein